MDRFQGRTLRQELACQSHRGQAVAVRRRGGPTWWANTAGGFGSKRRALPAEGDPHIKPKPYVYVKIRVTIHHMENPPTTERDEAAAETRRRRRFGVHAEHE